MRLRVARRHSLGSSQQIRLTLSIQLKAADRAPYPVKLTALILERYLAKDQPHKHEVFAIDSGARAYSCLDKCFL